MIERIVVPVGLLQQAEEFLGHAAVLAEAFAVPIVLLHVLEQAEGSVPDPLAWHFREEEAEAALNQAAERLRSRDLPAEVHLTTGQPASQILHFVRDQSDLILLHDHLPQDGERGVGHTGGVAWKVLNHAPAGVMRAPLARLSGAVGEDETGCGEILVPLDGSRRAECVLPHAVALATRLQHRLILAHVPSEPQTVRPSREGQQLNQALLARNRAWMESYLRRLCARLPVPCRWRVAAEEAGSETLLAWGREADLVLLSAHGCGCSRHRRYGQTAGRFLFSALETPVLVLQDLPAASIEPNPSARLLAEDNTVVRRPAPRRQVTL